MNGDIGQLSALPIVFAADGNFSVPLAIAVESLLQSAHQGTRYDIHVLDDGVLGFAKRHLEGLHDRYTFSITYHSVAEIVQGVSTTRYFPRVSFARFMIPDLFSHAECNRILYCDADVFVCRDLSELYAIDMGRLPVAAVIEMGVKVMGANRHLEEWSQNFEVRAKLDKTNYCNSGVLIFNCSEWTKGGYTEKIMKLARSEKGLKAKFPDQDILNSVCLDFIYPLPPAYNSVPLYAQCYVKDCLEFKETLIQTPYPPAVLSEALMHPYIIHFAGQKPRVLEGARYPLEQRFIDFWAKSAWRDYMPYSPRIGSMSPSRFIKLNVPISSQLGVLRKELLKYTMASCLPLPKRRHYAGQRDAIRGVLGRVGK